MSKDMGDAQDTIHAGGRVNESREGYVPMWTLRPERQWTGDSRQSDMHVFSWCLGSRVRAGGGGGRVVSSGSRPSDDSPLPNSACTGHARLAHGVGRWLRHPSGTQRWDQKQRSGVESKILQAAQRPCPSADLFFLWCPISPPRLSSCSAL